MNRLTLSFAVAMVAAALQTQSAEGEWYPWSDRYEKWQSQRPMLLGATHNCLPRDHLPERLARFKAAGLNTLVSTEYHADHFHRAAVDAGLQWATWHPHRFASPEWRVVNSALPYDGATALDAFEHVYRTPGCSFLSMADGPKTEQHLEWIAAFSKAVRARWPDVLTFSCLSIDKIDHDLYVAKTKPDVFCYFHYPLAEDGHELRGYLPDLRKARDSARRHHLPFWMYVQAWGAKRETPASSKRIPDEADIRYLLFTFLAHGGDGAIMFLYYGGAGGVHRDKSMVYDTVADHERAAPHLHRLENSVTTRAWHALRDVAPEVQTLAGTLLNLRSTDPIGYSGMVPESDRCHPFEGHGNLRSAVNLQDSKESVLVSFFEDRTGQEYFMVVNLVHGKDMSKVDGTRMIRLTFDESVTSIERLNRHTGLVESLKTREDASGLRFLEVQLEGGTGDLFKWSNGNTWASRPRSQQAERERPSDTNRARRKYRPLDTQSIDPALFKDAYAALGMERLMHPIDMADWPLKIGSERQLFVDDFLLASAKNLTRELHQPKPHPGNPVMKTREHPWEMMDGFSLFVLRDEKTGQFRMWYNSRIIYEAENGLRYRGPTGYATSKDGVNWTKPDLGLVKYGPDRHNNIVLGEGSINGLFYEPHDPDPQKRYKALVWHDPRGQTEYAPREGLYLYWSPDGIHWKGDNQRCVMPLRTGSTTTFPQTLIPGMGDTSNFVFDTKLNRYVCNGKILFRNPTMRTIGHSESNDLIHWTRPIMTMHRDRFDGDLQIGEITRIPYESMWLGMLGTYTWTRGWKQKYQQLAASRDGRHWSRVNPGQPFIALGDEDSWEPDFTIAGRPGPLLIGDELWFYYTGRQREERFKSQGIDKPHLQHVGLAKLRRDGFVSLRAGDKPGEVVTRPLTFAGSRLQVNAAVRPGGFVKVGLLTRDGKPVDGFNIDDAQPITGDATKIPVKWSGGANIELASGEHMRLQFRLKDADLYSFWIE